MMINENSELSSMSLKLEINPADKYFVRAGIAQFNVGLRQCRFN